MPTLGLDELSSNSAPSKAAVYVEAAAFYVACTKAGYLDEAQEFAEWFLDTFDIDLED